MARVSPVPDRASDSENEAAPSNNHANKKTKTGEEEPMAVDGQDEVEEGSAEETEYEIEAILDAKRGSFPDGRMGYFVKWKGYGENENSWVDEQDAGNAIVLIEDYWKRNPKKARKSVDAKTTKRPRKSAGSEEPTESPKKRGRKSQTAKESSATTEVKATKKAKKNGASKVIESDEESHPVDDDVVLTDMSKYMAISNWETLVKTIDTIERGPDETLYVYFTLASGERIKEGSRLCAERFPQTLIRFYEANLRWKSAGTEEADEP